MKNKKHKFHLPLKKRAESLIETIIAISVLAIGATATAVLVRTSILGNELSQDRMFALSLSQEGIEGVRSIRDTNWLKFSSDKENCWNTNPASGADITNCAANDNRINEGSYALELNLTGDVLAYTLDDSLIVPVIHSNYQLEECSIDNSDASDTGVLYITPVVPFADCTDIDYYRKVSITYDTGNPITGTLMTVTSEVGWYTDGNEKTVTLTEVIGNW